MERAKSVRRKRWGAMSSRGTAKGKLRNEGRIIAKTGMVSSKFEGWC